VPVNGYLRPLNRQLMQWNFQIQNPLNTLWMVWYERIFDYHEYSFIQYSIKWSWHACINICSQISFIYDMFYISVVTKELYISHTKIDLWHYIRLTICPQFVTINLIYKSNTHP
jgi:hypothetical protein